ncbi:hypothetical protein Tco_0394413 [Tanacetum coccineum]
MVRVCCVQNVQVRRHQIRIRGMLARGNGAAGQSAAVQPKENGAVLDEEELLFLDEWCDAFDSDVEIEKPNAQIYIHGQFCHLSRNDMRYMKYNSQMSIDSLVFVIMVTSLDAPSFDSMFVIGKLNEHIQSRGNTIRELKEKISRLTEKNSDADPTFDLKALVSQNKDLTAKLNALHDLNERFRAKNAKVKQHYKELYDSIKITHAKTTDQNNSLLSEIENLKAQLKDNSECVTIPDSKLSLYWLPW